jgi:hypothetical protein
LHRGEYYFSKKIVLGKRTTCCSEGILFFQEGWYLARGPYVAQKGYYFFPKKIVFGKRTACCPKPDTIFPRR